MSYQIIKKEQIDDVLRLNSTFTLFKNTIDEKQVTIDVNIFRPKNLTDIETSLNNMLVTLENKEAAKKAIESLLLEI